MPTFNWKDTIKANLGMLKILGMWPKSNQYTFGIYSFYTAIWITIFSIQLSCQIINVILSLDNFQIVITTSYIILGETIAAFKTFFSIKNVRILKFLVKMLDHENFQPKSISQVKLVQPSLNSWTLIFKTYWIAGGATLLFWVLFPILDKGYEEYRFPFLAWYPFNVRREPVYQLTYIYQVFAVFYMAFVVINIDTLIAALNMYLGAQFDILCDNLKNLGKTDNGKEDLNKCILHHKCILE